MSKRTRKNELPAGYERVQSGDFAAAHDFKKWPVLEGEVLNTKELTQGKGKDKRQVRLAIVHRGDIPVTLWESAALSSFFDQVKVGDRVYVRFDGFIKLRGRKQPMKAFTSAIKKGERRHARKAKETRTRKAAVNA